MSVKPTADNGVRHYDPVRVEKFSEDRVERREDRYVAVNNTFRDRHYDGRERYEAPLRRDHEVPSVERKRSREDYERSSYERYGRDDERRYADAPRRDTVDVKRVCREQQLPLKYKYFKLIQEGKKTIEGRIYSGPTRDLRCGDRLTFINQNEKARCEVVAIHVYNTFREMFSKENMQKLLPGVRTIEEGVRLYESLPGYPERVKRYGVAAIHIRLI
jgi:ASC-1-like (ASCH) protein